MTTLKESRTVGVFLAAMLALGACGGGGGGTQGSDAQPVAVTSGFSAVTAVETFQVNGRSHQAAANQLLVILVEDVTPAQYDAVVDKVRSLGATSIGYVQDLRMLQVTLPDSGDEVSAIATMKTMSGVAYATLNLVVETSRENPLLVPRSPLVDLPRPRALKAALDTTGRYWVDHINLSGAWAVEDELGITTGPLIAVVDTGLAEDQTIMAPGRVTRVDQWGGALTGDTTADVQAHGLRVSAFAAGYRDSFSGVSRFTNLLMVDIYRDECLLLNCPLGFFRKFYTDVEMGIYTAMLRGARVINVSWGATDVENCSDTHESLIATWQDAREVLSRTVVSFARRKDKLIVFAAGNDCEKRDDQLLKSTADPAADSWGSHALVVAASNASRRDALISHMGKVVNLAAPGEDISPNGTNTDSGTSVAAPLVTGTAGILQGICPDLSAPETRYLVMSGAEDTLGFADIKAAASDAVPIIDAWYGYTGENAQGPSLLLNAGNSAKAAKLLRNAPLTSLTQLELAKDATKEVSFGVDVPITGVAALDVVFLVDVTSSYADDIATLQSQANTIVSTLVSKGIDVQFGVSSFADFPSSPYGGPSDVPYRRLARMTGNTTDVVAAIDSLSLMYGNDDPEAQLEALYQVATGAGLDINKDGNYDAAVGDIEPQPMGFRVGAARVVLLATDAAFHDSDSETSYPGRGFAATVNALKADGIHVIALQSGSDTAAATDIALLVAGVGGESYQPSTDSALIANAISAGVDAAFANVELTVEKIGGGEWVNTITPAKVTVKSGANTTFTLQMKGLKSQSVDDLTYDVYVWVRANGSAVLKRVKVPIKVPK